MMNYEIVPLPKEKWKGTDVPIRYTTDAYYDLELTESDNAFSARMVKKQFETPVTHTPEEYDFPDKLYQDHWEKAEAYGIVGEGGALLACIELCPEEWSNRLMVTELWVADQLHRKGIGTRLMNLAKEKAKAQGRRAIILETQSCNVRAISFYRSQGFRLIGFDSCCYANNDIARHEIRFNFGFYLPQAATEGEDGNRPETKERGKMAEARIQMIQNAAEKQRTVRAILEALPEWFGIPEAREAYVRESAGQTMLAASEGGEAQGFLCLKETGKDTLEIAVMGVRKAYHRRGIGVALVQAAKEHAQEMGYSFLQVKTVQMGRYPEYDATNRFYLRCGFKEFEVFPTLWDEWNPCQSYVMALDA